MQTLSAQLSWSHFVKIIYIKDSLQRHLTEAGGAGQARAESPAGGGPHDAQSGSSETLPPGLPGVGGHLSREGLLSGSGRCIRGFHDF